MVTYELKLTCNFFFVQDSDEEELDDDDYDAPVNYKKMKVHIKSTRADAVVSAGLDIARK